MSCFYFNPHSHKGSDKYCRGTCPGSKYFNPHSHKGSDGVLILEFARSDRISIHTPTRGVTSFKYIPSLSYKFQSTLPQGEWRGVNDCRKPFFKFQSTLPQGEWLSAMGNSFLFFWFQSTLPQGEWLASFSFQCTMRKFQSTLPQGEWPRDSRFRRR